MVVRGRVHNGVVILNDGVRLPEGQEVTVVAGGTASAAAQTPGPMPHSLLHIPAVSLGPVVQILNLGDDLLDEMLEGRPCKNN